MNDDEDARTLWCGNLSEKITNDLLYELFYQAGPLDKVRIPKDREGRPRNFGFVTYTHLESLPYAIDLFKGTTLFDRKLSLKIQKGSVIRNGGSVPSPDVAMLLGRPLNINPQFEAEVKAKFVAMMNQPIIDGFADVHFGNYEQPAERLTAASLQGQWSSRHNPMDNRSGRRFEPYKNDGGRRADRDRGGRSSDREDSRQRLERYPRNESRDPRDRSRGYHFQNGNGHGHRNHSRD